MKIKKEHEEILHEFGRVHKEYMDYMRKHYPLYRNYREYTQNMQRADYSRVLKQFCLEASKATPEIYNAAKELERKVNESDLGAMYFKKPRGMTELEEETAIRFYYHLVTAK